MFAKDQDCITIIKQHTSFTLLHNSHKFYHAIYTQDYIIISCYYLSYKFNVLFFFSATIHFIFDNIENNELMHSVICCTQIL